MRKSLMFGVGVVSATLTLAACSSSGGSGSGGTGAASVSSTAKGTPITVGAIGGYSGAQASSIGGAKKAVQAWADSVNAAGGISGHPIKLVIKDDGDDAAKALTAVKALVEQEHVVAIIDDESNVDTTWASYVSGKGIPVIGGTTVNTPFLNNPDFFPSGTNAIALTYAVLAEAAKIGPKTATLYCAESPQCASLPQLQMGIAPAAKVAVAYTAKVSGTAPDYTAVCQGLKNSGASSYFVASGQQVVLRVAQACKQQGVNATLLEDDGAVTQSFVANPASEGLISPEGDAPWFDTSTPAMQAYQTAISKYASGIGDANGPNAFYAWVSGKLFEAAVQAGGSTTVTAESVKTGLYALKGETLGGIAPPLTFTSGKATLVNCYFVLGVKGGKFVTPNGLTTQCAPDALVSAVVASIPK